MEHFQEVGEQRNYISRHARCLYQLADCAGTHVVGQKREWRTWDAR
jgi:hypothetical protein